MKAKLKSSYRWSSITLGGTEFVKNEFRLVPEFFESEISKNENLELETTAKTSFVKKEVEKQEVKQEVKQDANTETPVSVTPETTFKEAGAAQPLTSKPSGQVSKKA